MQWGLMICVFCISHVPALLTLDIPGYEGRNLLLIAFLVIVVQSSDVLQYVWGKLFGKHKVAPRRLAVEDRRRAGRRRASAPRRSARRCGGSRRSRPWQAALMALAIT